MAINQKKWAIIGGGPHGVHLAIRLRHAGVPAANIHIIDPHPRLLAHWQRCTQATGMKYLRSPVVHHLDIDPYALANFAKSRAGRSFAMFMPPYRRPGLQLFQAHCEALIEQYDLGQCHVQASVEALSADAQRWQITTNRSEVSADHVVLAIGSSSELNRPAWAHGIQSDRIAHLFEQPSEHPARATHTQRLVVVGGGISAAQAALALAARHEVTLLRRHQPRIHMFDSDPGWLGPLNMRGFSNCNDLAARRTMIRQARHRGSMPPELARKLHCKTRLGVLRVVEDEVQSATLQSDDVLLALKDHQPLQADRVVLATGMNPHRPGGMLVDDLINKLQLPVATCGFPIVQPNLQWHPGLFVMGGLAELQLGPTSRNIAGAREAAARIMTAASAQPKHGTLAV